MKYRLQCAGVGKGAGIRLTPVALFLSPLAVCLAVLPACGTSAKLQGIEGNGIAAELRLPEDLPDERVTMETDSAQAATHPVQGSHEPFVMETARDESTGETSVVDRLDAAVIKARFRHAAERNGIVKLLFQVIVPESMQDPEWQIRIHPHVSFLGREYPLEDVLVTGEKYRRKQLRGYEHYRRFLSRIVSDSLDFMDMHSLEIFVARNIPELYALKRDSSLVSDSEFESRFGVTSAQAAEHYARRLLMKRNARLDGKSKEKFMRYVKAPFPEGVRLDTVMTDGAGDFICDYVEDIPAVSGLRKIDVWLCGEIYMENQMLYSMPDSETMTYYVSSISSLCDTVPAQDKNCPASYREGIRLLQDCRYDEALDMLLPFRDYNTAVALVALGRDGFAHELLEEFPSSGKASYLLAIVSARSGQESLAVDHLLAACRQEPSLRHRARLDPEVAALIDKYELEELIQNL